MYFSVLIFFALRIGAMLNITRTQVPKCGKVKSIPNMISTRILGGKETVRHNYNWMVVVITNHVGGNTNISILNFNKTQLLIRYF